MLAELIVKALVPFELTTSVLVAEEPTVTLPKLSEVALMLTEGCVGCVVAACPVPASETARVVLPGTFVERLSVPDKVPVAGGLN